jgi:hypothetical protein
MIVEYNNTCILKISEKQQYAREEIFTRVK